MQKAFSFGLQQERGWICKMTDILGRELKAGDIVVCMAIGRYSSGMHLGVQTETDVVLTKSGKKNPYNRYLIENPTEAEKAYIQEVLKQEEDRLAEKKQKEEARRSMKAIPRKELKVGYKYEDDRGNEWVYMGWCKVALETDLTRGLLEVEGYLYFSKWDIMRIEEGLWPFAQISQVNIFKTPKRLVKELECVSFIPTENNVKWCYQKNLGRQWWRWLSITIERIKA